jgi:rhodanese-related sulfurtransferase
MIPTIPWQRVTVSEAQALCKRTDLMLFDVRDPISFTQGHLERAQHLAEANLEQILFNTPKKTPVLIYCYHGNASQTYAKIFADFGFKEIYDLIDGYEAWRIRSLQIPDRVVNVLPEPLNAWLTAHDFHANTAEATIGNQTTPLMCACRLGELPMVKELVQLGVDVNALNSDGNNALWFACFNDNLDTIDYLVQNGIDIDHQNDNGATCLMYAASASKHQVVERLLAAGADTSLKSLDDFTALDMVASLECLNLLRRVTKTYNKAKGDANLMPLS